MNAVLMLRLTGDISDASITAAKVPKTTRRLTATTRPFACTLSTTAQVSPAGAAWLARTRGGVIVSP